MLLVSVLVACPGNQLPCPTPTGPGLGPGEIALFFAAVVAYIGFISIMIAVGYVVTGLTLMRFFRRVGVAPWIAWVPVYNTWTWLQVGGHEGALALLSFVPIGSTVVRVFLIIGMYRSGRAMGKEDAYVILGVFLPFVWCYLMGDPTNAYDPSVFVRSGWPPPRAGYLSEWVPPQPASA